jgi:hypothetical protein
MKWRGQLARCLLVLFVIAWAAAPARADVERFALLIGNDAGASHEQRLRFAETDAERVYAALRELGGFSPANIVLLRGETMDTVRSTLITLNDRLRERASIPGSQTMLFVYYSGHADTQSIHLGNDRLSFEELARLVRGSAAHLRLLVVDACRSGMLTRVKGGRPLPPFALPEPQTQLGEGFALLTASTANEDAQESDELGASFFTHALVSGLRGAADTNADGRISLDEVYRHTYSATLRASSQSAQGTQHPTFQYEVRGREAPVLTTLRTDHPGLAQLSLPEGPAFLLFKQHAQGQVVAELAERGRARTLTLPAGRYFVRGRAEDSLLEGDIELPAGKLMLLDTSKLQRVAYARLVRKGGSPARLAQGPLVMATVRSSIAGAHAPCFGGALAWALHFRHLSVLPRLDYCRSGFQNAMLEATTDDFGVGLSALHTWDRGALSFAMGLALSTQLGWQRFDTPGHAPARLSVSPYSGLVAMFGAELGAGVNLGLEARAETYLLRLTKVEAGREHATWDAALALRGGVGLSKLF